MEPSAKGTRAYLRLEAFFILENLSSDHQTKFRVCHEDRLPRRHERQRTQLLCQGDQREEVVPSSSQVTLEPSSQARPCAEEAVGGTPLSTAREERWSDQTRSLAHVGELSAVRGALDAAPVTPGTMTTFGKLTDPQRRPPEVREELC